jgi:RNA polymerase sigma factor (sigma-70 family)
MHAMAWSSTVATDPDIRAAAEGDRLAYGRLVERYSTLVTTIALSVVRDVATSEDVGQEVFLAVWRGLPRLRNGRSFLPWLRQLTRYLAINQLRRRPRMMLAGEDADQQLAALADPRPDAEARMIADAERSLLVDALEAVPAESREVVLLYYREGHSTAQVAALLELRETTVRKRLERARAQLRHDWAARLEEVARTTAPGVVFTATVIAAITSATPAHAAAAATGLAGGGKLVAGAAGKLLSASAPEMAATAGAISKTMLLGPLAGVLLGWWLQWRDSLGYRERLGLLAILMANLTLTAALPVVVVRTASALPVFAFLVLMTLIHFVWLPYVIRLRLASDERARRRFGLFRIGGLMGLTVAALVTIMSMIFDCL